MRKLAILLSTFNGEKYIQEQINSIKSQKFNDFVLNIRDDGSTDKTVEIIRNHFYEENIVLNVSNNIGVIDSFFTLLKDGDYEFYAFCDQDDVWKEDKLQRAVSRLGNISEQEPALYCSNLDIVDENLNYIGSLPKRKKAPSFCNAMVQNVATGCTIVMNKAARDLLIERLPEDTSDIVMHDWWGYLVVSAFGKIIYDPVPSLMYRQHSTNTLGSGYKPIGRWISRYKRFVVNKERKFITKQLKLFYTQYEDLLSNEKKGVLEEYLNSRNKFFNRLSYSLTAQVYRQPMSEQIVLRVLLFLNLV